MSGPYATWDAALAAGNVTDEPDGWPDREIVPLVEQLRAAGVVTLQSCAGHKGSDDGCLWIRDDPEIVERLVPIILVAAPFTEVKRTYHPERRWEIGWHADDADRAMKRLAEVLLVDRSDG